MKLHNSFWTVVLLAATAFGAGCNSANPLAPDLGIPFSATDLVVGTGTVAAAGTTARVYYRGWLYSTTAAENKGSQFDSNTTGLGFQFVIGADNVIQGWHQGVAGMKVGGKRRLVIPPSLAYGKEGRGQIPGNATLVFEIELLGVAG